MPRTLLVTLALAAALPAAAQVSLKLETAQAGVGAEFTMKLDEKSFFDASPFTGSGCTWTLDLGDGRRRVLHAQQSGPYGYDFDVQYPRPGRYTLTATPDRGRCHHQDAATAQVTVTADWRALELELFAVPRGRSDAGRPPLAEQDVEIHLMASTTLEAALQAQGPDARAAAEALLRNLAQRAGAKSVKFRWRPDEHEPGSAPLIAVQRWQREYRDWDRWAKSEAQPLGLVNFDQIGTLVAQLQERRREAEAERQAGLRRQLEALAAAEGHWAAVKLSVANGVWCGAESADAADWAPTYLKNARVMAWARPPATVKLRWVQAPGNPLVDNACGIIVGPAPVLAAWVQRAGVAHPGLEILAPTPMAELLAERAQREGFADGAAWRWARELGPGTKPTDLQRLREAGLEDTAAVNRVRDRMTTAGYGSDRSVGTVLAFLADEREGRAKGLSAVAWRQQADAAAAERARAEREAQLREFPWTAEFRCTYQGADLGVIQCLLGPRSGEGWISLVNGPEQRIVQPADVTMGMERLRLRARFQLSALNVSDYVLKVIVRDARTGQVVAERAAPPRGRLMLVP